MANEDNLLPISIRNIEHIAAFDAMASARMSALELEVLLVYMIDTVAPSALYYLADQFNITGYSGWKQAETEEAKREVIKQAINLQRWKGTVWAIKEAMRVTGFEDAQLIEGVGHWAEFDIRLDINSINNYTGKAANLLKLVEEYKNVRSHLLGVSFTTNQNEQISPSESFWITEAIDESEHILAGSVIYNGANNFDGSVSYIGDLTETLTITIIP